MKTTDIQAAIFDFDYTLADSSRGAVECINFALKEMGLAEASKEVACRTIGLSLKDTFLTLAGHQEGRRCDEFSRLFVQRADEVMAKLTVVYESVPPMVEALREGGLRLGIVSTKFRYRIEEILKRETLLQCFEVVIGGEDVEQHKPHPQGLLKAVERLQCSLASIVYVGDSVADAELAKRAAVPFVVVLSGVTPREHFDSYEAVGIIESLSELPTLVGRFHRSGS
jgi:phosphoglycolate phosphatase